MSSADDSSSPKTYVLRSSDGETFEVEEPVAVQSVTVKHLIEDGCADTAIPLPNVKSKILANVIRHVPDAAAKAPSVDGGAPPAADEAWKAFDAAFIKIDLDTLYELIMAANYLGIKNLLELACQTVADLIKGKSPEDIRTIFSIKNDFTAEEDAEIRKEHPWAFV